MELFYSKYSSFFGSFQTFILTLVLLSILIPMQSAYGSFYFINSLRAQAMGNAFIAVSNDEHAPFYNPAGLTYLKQDLHVTVGLAPYGEIVSAVNDIREVVDFVANASGENGTEEILAMGMNDFYYKVHTIPLAFTVPNFAMGSYGVANMYASYGISERTLSDIIDSINLPNITNLSDLLDQDNLADLIDNIDLLNTPFARGYVEASIGSYIAGSSDFSLGIGRLSYGANMRYGYRMHEHDILVSLEEDFAVSSVDTSLSAIADLGLMYSLPLGVTEYRMGLSYNNLFIHETLIGYKAEDGESAQSYTSYFSPPVMNFGTAFMFPINSLPFNSTVTLAADLVDVLDESSQGSSIENRIGIGTEVELYDRFALRAGLNEGYGSWGAGIKLAFLQLSYAYYVENHLEYAPADTAAGSELSLFSTRGTTKKHVLSMGVGF